MSNVFIIHGAYGHPNENWFPWLKRELEKFGCKVFVPRFPTPEDQTLENWLRVFEEYERYLDKDSIVVGHSLGVAFLLNVLERLDRSIKAAFFVAGFISLLNNPTFDEFNKTFIDRRFDWDKIKKSCRKFYVFHSDNDPYVPLEHGKELANNLRVDVIIVENAGHFNEEAGYTSFELLLEKIKDELS